MGQGGQFGARVQGDRESLAVRCMPSTASIRVPGHGTLHRQHLLVGAWAKGNAVSRARTQTVQWTICAWRGAGPLARRGLQGYAAACSGLSVRASSESPSLSAERPVCLGT